MSDVPEVRDRVNEFMRGWDRGEPIAYSSTAQGGATLMYSDLGALLDACVGLPCPKCGGALRETPTHYECPACAWGRSSGRGQVDRQTLALLLADTVQTLDKDEEWYIADRVIALLRSSGEGGK